MAPPVGGSTPPPPPAEKWGAHYEYVHNCKSVSILLSFKL